MHIIFNVLYWNVIIRIQYRTQLFSRLFGSKKLAVYIHAVIIFSMGLSRDYLFKYVVGLNNKLEGKWNNEYITYISYFLLAIGLTLVATSTYQLGIVGTYQGDAYGILLPGIVTSFPYNICSSPMYLGSTINFISYSLLNRSIIGLVMTLLVALVYYIGSIFEE